MLAGVSIEYLTRLEQGRDRRPSPQVLMALAQALRLRGAELEHLYRLSKVADTGLPCMADAAPTRVVRPTVRMLLERLEPTPAVLLNRLTEALAWTDGFERLAAPIGLLDGTPPNVARFVFTDERARTVFLDWDRVADEQVAELKQGVFGANRYAMALVDELTAAAGASFARRIDTVTAVPQANGVLRLLHPLVGELRLAYETLALPSDDDQRLVVHLPADEATTAALARLHAPRSRRLRAVSD